MAQHKDFGLIGAGRNLQLGKQGPKFEGNADSGAITISNAGGSLVVMKGANASSAEDFVTKAQLDSIGGSIITDGFSLQLGNISSNGDSSWTDGAVQTITNTTSVAESIDQINEALENVRNDTFVKTVDFTVDNDTGGAPLTSTLTINVTGNANQYEIDWGDGT